ncbi:MAG TPA: GNAT family N-acetyltransferase [Polyangiaceae bacterium]|jgi:GNAT superfamily N-acetyltransferase|nr:MAG: Acetyltransferase (GNAT) family protein [Deltaproteobacteria bacterium ADurb.Bin207]HNS95726.1 GNAT family N-acetyltransferase [Polyangiaceae bacterium]HNZ21193.1 GNAT family N-acetyltransferase [Polyangiaceae bacterium]HOD25366.1 GNAT family N-acetyltransferase [Polyangiaceae bacterium]HOE48061.1 GNAT family N-acetyltransferase [Polyangiaceae bacterium]
MNKADYDEIVRVIDWWWGGPTASLAHPVFFYELGKIARIMEVDGKMIGFLLGFLTAEPPPIGYIHMVGIHPDYRRRHVGRKLYESFEDSCRSAGCTLMKAVTAPGDERSVQFHEALGWVWETVPDYAGPGRARVVFTKRIG